MRVGALQNGGSNSQWKRRATFTWTNPVVASKWAIDQSTQANRSAKQSTIAKQWANSGKTNRFHSSGISRPIQRNHQTERIHVTRTIDIDRRPIDTTRGIFFFSFGAGFSFHLKYKSFVKQNTSESGGYGCVFLGNGALIYPHFELFQFLTSNSEPPLKNRVQAERVTFTR